MTKLDQKIDEILNDLHHAHWKKHYSDYHVNYLSECLKHISLNGLWMEFGVYRGRTITFLSSHTQNIVYGFGIQV